MTIAGMEMERAKLLRRVLKAETETCLEELVEKFPEFGATRGWLRNCCNPPSLIQLKLTMANDLCEGNGVEYSEICAAPLRYINMGDSYDTTLCRFRGAWKVACWADFAEKLGID